MKQNYEAAASAYLSAAEKGEAYAQVALGSLYRTGKGVEKDYVEAYKWLSMAAEQEHGVEVKNLLGQVLTSDQQAEAQKRIAQLKKTE